MGEHVEDVATAAAGMHAHACVHVPPAMGWHSCRTGTGTEYTEGGRRGDVGMRIGRPWLAKGQRSWECVEQHHPVCHPQNAVAGRWSSCRDAPHTPPLMLATI